MQRLIVGRRAAQFDDWFPRRGFPTVLTARLIPLVPFSLFNYATGVMGISLRAYALATLLEIVPGGELPYQVWPAPQCGHATSVVTLAVKW